MNIPTCSGSGTYKEKVYISMREINNGWLIACNEKEEFHEGLVEACDRLPVFAQEVQEGIDKRYEEEMKKREEK